MNIIPKDLTIHSLLLNPTEQLLVPAYQRRYAWGESQAYALFEDIDMLQPNEGHLFGMLILHTGYYHGGINTVDVVDGQQRLTTISLLLEALKRKFEELNEREKYNQITTLLICGSGSEKRNKIKLGDLDDKDYNQVLSGDQGEIKNLKLLNNYNNFLRWIDNRIAKDGEDWIEGFYFKLVHTAKIIRLDVQSAQDAYKLFETINNRGLKLSATDILKNYILGHAAKIGEEKLERIRNLWARLITTLDNIPTDDFFRQYVSSIYTRKITKSKLIETFKDHYLKNVQDVNLLGEYAYNIDFYENEDEDIEEENTFQYDKKSVSDNVTRIDLEEYLKSIIKAAEVYARIWNVDFDNIKLNRSIAALNHIKSFPTYIYLMHYLQRDTPISEQLEIVRIVYSLMLRRHVCKRKTSINDNIFAHLLRIDYSDNYVDDIRESLMKEYPSDDEFRLNFPSHELKGKLISRAKYILTEIEYFITGDTGELTVNSGNDVHLEHIIPLKIKPQNWKDKFGDWESYLGENALFLHEKKVHTIGNMTLLAGDLNITASNNPFNNKKWSYRKSNITLNNTLSEQQKFKFEDLDDRGKMLADLAVKIWKIT